MAESRHITLFDGAVDSTSDKTTGVADVSGDRPKALLDADQHCRTPAVANPSGDRRRQALLNLLQESLVRKTPFEPLPRLDKLVVESVPIGYRDSHEKPRGGYREPYRNPARAERKLLSKAEKRRKKERARRGGNR